VTAPAPFQIRRPRVFRDTRYISVGTLPEIEATPPDGCARQFHFVPMFIDNRVCRLPRVVADRYPHGDTVMYREPCGAGTAYWQGTYGMAWPVDIDRADAPLFFQAVSHA
jgi:hypothetical protein